MKNTISPEVKTTLFYVFYFVIASIGKRIDKGGPCTPGFGDALFLLLIPISIIYFFILIYKNYKSRNNFYLTSIYIHLVLWVILFICIQYNMI